MGRACRRLRLALSIRQPWAWLIVKGYKDVENRTWDLPSELRRLLRKEGSLPFLVHAGRQADPDDIRIRAEVLRRFGITIPTVLPMGGIVGAARIVAVVQQSDSPWFTRQPGNYGFVLRSAVELPFRPCLGQMGFFEVDYANLPKPHRVPQKEKGGVLWPTETQTRLF